MSDMSPLFWILIFIISLVALVKGADWFLESAEKIGLTLGMSPFLVGVLIVGLGTSFPELVSGFFALFKGVNEFVIANAVGSNITNILLVIGVAAVAGKHLLITKDLIDLDLPLLGISTLMFLGVAWDGKVVLAESLLLLAIYAIYLWYALSGDDHEKSERALPAKVKRRWKVFHLGGFFESQGKANKIKLKDLAFLLAGGLLLFIGAKYLVDSVISLSEIFAIAPTVIAIGAVALGTSLPELIVSIKAALQKKSDVVLGNILGSNVFNLLGVVGIPGLFGTLYIDSVTFYLGLPVLLASTFMFVIVASSKRIHIWEGAMFLILYIFFIGKLFSLF